MTAKQAKQLAIEAANLTDKLWFAKMDIEKQMCSAGDDTDKVIALIAKWTRTNDVEMKALERSARRLAKQVDAEAIA